MPTPPPQDWPSPYGLGWARKFALLNAPEGLGVRELFDRQLFLGLGIASATSFAVSGLSFSLYAWLSNRPEFVAIAIPSAICGVVAALLNLICLGAFLVRGGSLKPYAHGVLLSGFWVPILGAAAMGGAPRWAETSWFFLYFVVATLLTGIRGGLAWTVISIATWIGLAHLNPAPLFPVPPEEIEKMAANGFLGPACFVLLAMAWSVQQRNLVERMLEEERVKAEALLHNVLPAGVAERLKRGEVVADQQEEVSVVFADLVGFTTIAAGVSARRLVEMLGEIFGEMDRIATEEGVEKVKTIGDCYMAVAGAPVACRDHAERAVRFASRVQTMLEGKKFFGSELKVRIGVHSGPAVAGVLGEKRILYDLWGDTVNIASRLESTGAPGRVQISEHTARLLEGNRALEDRGLVPLKGREPVRAYLLPASVGTAPLRAAV